MFWLQQKIVVPGAKPFQPGRDEDAGWDIFGIEDHYKIPILTSVEIKTGIATAFPKGYVGLVLDRSGLGFKGMIRHSGVMDSGFRGQWIVKLTNIGNQTLAVESVIRNPNAKAIVQVVFVPCFKCGVNVVDELPPSDRGEGGFGSTDQTLKDFNTQMETIKCSH